MRLDVYLFDSGECASRTEAKSFISDGCVTVNGVAVTKPAYDVSDSDVITVDKSGKKYASRGGLKLEHALDTFAVSPMGKSALDVGASSGGFTDCLLQRGARAVVAVDSGSGQLLESLRRDRRVTSIENYNARFMRPEDLPFIPELAVMDVSFISATYIIPAVYAVLADGADFICLVKPQFEVGKSGIGKGGIVKDVRLRESALKKVTDFAAACGFSVIATTTSPITGGDGNTEYLAHFRKEVSLCEKSNNSSES